MGIIGFIFVILLIVFIGLYAIYLVIVDRIRILFGYKKYEYTRILSHGMKDEYMWYEDGSIDYTEDIDWYAPNSDWNDLMKVCKKIIKMYFDKREDIFSGLQECDIDKTYKACVEFIKFWNDDTQPKMTWNK